MFSTSSLALLVAPYVGAWIETVVQPVFQHPKKVAPYVGAWIETCVFSPTAIHERVAPYVGAWIETYE